MRTDENAISVVVARYAIADVVLLGQPVKLAEEPRQQPRHLLKRNLGTQRRPPDNVREQQLGDQLGLFTPGLLGGGLRGAQPMPSWTRASPCETHEYSLGLRATRVLIFTAPPGTLSLARRRPPIAARRVHVANSLSLWPMAHPMIDRP